MGAKRFILLFSALLVIATKLSAQFPNPLDFNTATNATNNGTIPIGGNDLHWTVSMTGINGTYVPAVSCGVAAGGWAIPLAANYNWITYPHACPTTTSNAIHTCLGDVDEYYKLTFNLPPAACNGISVSTPSAYCLSMDYFADNVVYGVYVNSTLYYSNPVANYGAQYGFTQANGKSLTLCNGWQPGTNTLTVRVRSGPSHTGLLARVNQTVTTSTVPPVSAVVTVTNVTCNGGNNGTASVSPSGGNGTYTYTWLPGGSITNVNTNLSAGVYTVIVSSGSCTYSTTANITQPGPFTLSVSPSSSVCQGTSTTFTAAGGTTYTWSTGSNSSSITVNTGGVYSVSASNGQGCKSTQTVALTVNPNPVMSVAGDTLLCKAGESATLTASGASTYTWLPGNFHNPVVVYNPNSNSIYTVNGTDSLGCSGTATIGVNISNFVFSVGSNTQVCSGQQATLTANGAGTYTWYPGNYNGNPVVIVPNVTQTYTVQAGVGTCSYSGVQTVSVVPLPVISIGMNTASVTCVGDPVLLTAYGGVSYVWFPGNFYSPSIIVAPSTPQTYTVIGSVGTCTGMAVQQVTVEPAVAINFSEPYLELCPGAKGTIVVNGANSYTWNPGQITGNTFTVQPDQTSTYTVTAYNGTCTTIGTINVFVNGVTANFIENSATSSYIDPVEFTNLSSNSVINNWYFSNGQTSTQTDPRISFDEPGTYVACLLTQNNIGCLDTICKAIHVGCPEDAVFIPNTFTPNDDGLNDIFRVSTVGQCLETFEMIIFDRWGENIFSSDKLEKGWDGKIKGTFAKNDVYVYMVNYTMINKKSYSKTGHVALMK